jgi:hypothetical protein
MNFGIRNTFLFNVERRLNQNEQLDASEKYEIVTGGTLGHLEQLSC